LWLLVDPNSGSSVLRNSTTEPITFHAYTIHDSVASLRPDDWFSLQDQGYDNQIWFETPPTATQLTELTIASETTLAPGQVVYLGELADPNLIEDLTFEYLNFESGVQSVGSVLFAESVVPPLPGDYNGDLVVDAADYTSWRDSLGGSVDSFQGADGNGDGTVDAADYKLWKRQFGKCIQLTGFSAANVIASVESGAMQSTSLQSVDDVSAQSASLNLDAQAQDTQIVVGPRIKANRAAPSPLAADAVLSRFDAQFKLLASASHPLPSYQQLRSVLVQSNLDDCNSLDQELIGHSRTFDFENWDNPPYLLLSHEIALSSPFGH
jgi:hypothetical protein